MKHRRHARLAAALGALALALPTTACHGPAPIDSSVEFSTERGIVRGVSTEEGILALRDIVPASGELSFRYRTGNNFFDDVATLVRASDALAVMAPKSSRPNLARFAAYPAARDELLLLEVRTADDTDLLQCHLLEGGERGDFVVLDEGKLADVAHRYAGAGLFAWRDGTMELVGILNGVYCEDPRALAFIGLDEMATLIPAESSYFVRRVLPRRSDFEFGIPRDFDGEQSPASDAPSDVEPAGAAAPPKPPEPAPTNGGTPRSGS